MNLNILFFYFVTAIIVLSSCSKNDPTQENDQETNPINPLPNPMEIPNIYIIVNEDYGTSGVWKNEEMMYDQLDYANCIYVSDNNDIYVAGRIGKIPVVWKNGKVLYELVDQYSEVNHIRTMYIDGDDLYLGGYSLREYDWFFAPIVWKNGKRLITYNGSKGKYLGISALRVYKGEVYAVCEDQKISSNITSVWKNNQKLYDLPCSIANTIYVSNNDVYVTGSTTSGNVNPFIKIFKNGKELYHIPDIGHAYSFYSDKEIFTVGYTQRSNNKQPIAQIWKNDNKLYDMPYRAEPKAIFVYGGDVYTAGNSFNVNKDNYIAYVWKNDKILYQLTDGKGKSSDIIDMFVK